MTDVSRAILSDYQVRKTRAQKTAFIMFLRGRFPDLLVEEGGLLRNRNLVIGDPDTAKLIVTAHYDTCAELPFPNFLTPKNFLVYLLYNLLVMIPIFLLTAGFAYLMGRVTQNFWVAYWSSLGLFALVFTLLFAGKANPHTANDNTSGVVTLCELLCAMDGEARRQTAFVFFDNEELGLFGSALFRKMHGKALQGKLLVNLDCVSDGDALMIIQNKRARALYGEALRHAFAGTEGKTILLERASSVFYPSDQIHFSCYAAVAAFRKSKIFGYYLDKIHTRRDTVFDERNITYLCESLCRLARELMAR